MTGPVQLSRLVTSAEIDASKYKAGADVKVAADRAMVSSAQAAGQAIAATDTKISQSGSGITTLLRGYVEGEREAQRFEADIRKLGRALDAGKTDIAQAATVLVGMNQKLGLSANASELAAKGQTQLAAAVRAANAQIEGQALAAERATATAKRMQAANAMPLAANQNRDQSVYRQGNFNTANIAAQFQDIGVTSAMGMSPLQIALQQGTQLSAVLGPLGAAGAAKTLGSALLSIVSPASLVTLALVGGTAAAIQYFMKGREGTKSLDDALKAHEAQLKLIEEGWGKAAIAEQKYGKQSASAATFGFEMSTSELRAQLRKQVPDVLSAISSATSDNISDIGGARAFRGSALFKLLSAEIGDLVERAKDGQPDIIGLTQRLEELGDASDNQGIRNLADDIANAVRPVEELARKVLEANKQLEELRRNFGPGGIPLRRGMFSTEDMSSLDQYNAAEGVAAQRRRQATDARLQEMYARSPEERAAAARAAAAAQYNNDESASARRDRIETAGKLALAEANHSLAEAQKDRALSLDRTLASQQLDLTLIGKTAGETARLRMEFEQIAAVREEAAQKGIAADEKEIERIKEKAAAYGQFADEIARANLARDLGFERDQMFRSPQDQQIASRQQGAGLAVDLNSPEAQQMRDLARFADAKGLAVGFLTDFKAEMLRNGGDVGKALGNSILNALTKSMDDQLGNIFDRLATWIASALTGQMPGASLAGGAGFAANTTLSAFLGASNDNYAPGAVTRSPLGSIAGMDVWAQAIRSIESDGSGGYSALGPWTRGDRAYGAYQVMGANIPSWSRDALGRTLTPSQFLADPGAQDAIFKNQFGKYVSRYGNPQDAASAWFTGGPLSAGAGRSDILGTTGSAYVDKFNAAVAKATEGLGGFDNTVTNAIGTLTDKIGGSDGLASILEGLKPENFTANTSLSEILGYSGGGGASGGGGGWLGSLFGSLFGLLGFENGTDFAPGGLARINERGRGEIVDLPRGSRVIPHDVSMRMAANANRPAQPPKIDLHVTVIGGSGDEHIRKLSQQGAQQAIAEYHEGQTRGGFGDTQRRYASQKG